MRRYFSSIQEYQRFQQALKNKGFSVIPSIYFYILKWYNVLK